MSSAKTTTSKPPKESRHYSIVRRMTTVVTVSLIVTGTLVMGLVYYGLWEITKRESYGDVVENLRRVSRILKNVSKYPDVFSHLNEIYERPQTEVTYVRILDSTGKEVANSPAHPGITFPEPHLAQLPGDLWDESYLATVSKYAEFEFINNHPYIIYSTATDSIEQDYPGYRTQIIIDLDRRLTLLHRYYMMFLLVFVASTALAIFFSWRVAKFAFRSVSELTEQTQHIQTENLSARLPAEGLPSELSELIATQNAMLDRIEQAFDQLSRFTADIAHELRTPVGNVRGAAELMLSRARSEADYRDALGSILEEAKRISEIIDSLLFLAKSEALEKSIKFDEVQVLDTVNNLVDFYQVSAEEHNVTFRIDIPSQLTIVAERTLFQRALSNLISNAIKYSPTGGTITISTQETPDGVSLAVLDQGEGILPEDLPRVFERFYRGKNQKKSTGGYGLGLTIVHAIMRLHKGAVGVETEPGLWTRLHLDFQLEVQREFRRTLGIAKHSASLKPNAKNPQI